MKIRNYKLKIRNLAGIFLVSIIVFSCAFSPTLQVARAQMASIPAESENINSSGFRLTICDGPTIPKGGNVPTPTNLGHPYVPCDFTGLMMQVQHLINIAIILGVLVAIIGFCYMGYLYITGTEKNIGEAKKIFPYLFWGFIFMLTAWFIVYQILSWLTGGSGFDKLLGS